MQITATKLTDIDLLHLACESTMHQQIQSKMSLAAIYNCEHSPIRTQMFTIEMKGILNFVSVHLVRHNVGVQHFVKTMRTDRGAIEIANRLTLTDHTMILNAQTLINMARKRLCYKASDETRDTFNGIIDAVALVDEDLPKFLEPDCIYRGGYCHEMKMCGRMDGVVWSGPKTRFFKRYGY